MRELFFIACFFGVILCGKSQSNLLSQSQGARSHGMGSVRLNLPDSWSYFNNIGALNRIEDSQISANYDSRYGLKELQTVSIAGAFKQNWGTLGIGISRFGGKLFNQQTLGLGFSNQLGIVSFGLKAELFQTNIEGFGTASSVLVSFGGLAELGPKLFLGAHVSNVNRGKISRQSQERLPSAIQMGISYFPSNSLKLLIELEKDLEVDPVLKTGIEYILQDLVSLRAGIKSKPGDLFFGIGISPGKFIIDYAFGQNLALGSTNHLSLGIRWRE